MFGMLDYRAHKLFWFLSRPLWLIGLLLIVAASVASCLIAFRLVDNILLQFVVALIALQVLGVIVFFRGFNSPVHRDLGAGEGVKNFLR